MFERSRRVALGYIDFVEDFQVQTPKISAVQGSFLVVLFRERSLPASISPHNFYFQELQE
jgi:hypothetical protein